MADERGVATVAIILQQMFLERCQGYIGLYVNQSCLEYIFTGFVTGQFKIEAGIETPFRMDAVMFRELAAEMKDIYSGHEDLQMNEEGYDKQFLIYSTPDGALCIVEKGNEKSGFLEFANTIAVDSALGSLEMTN